MNLWSHLVEMSETLTGRVADDLGFERIWWQEGGTVSESFVPAFDATGVEGPELPRA